MKTIFLALCLFAAPLQAQDYVIADAPQREQHVSVTHESYRDTLVLSRTIVDEVYFVALAPIDTTQMQLVNDLYAQTQACVQMYRPMPEIFVALLIYEIVDGDMNDINWSPLQELAGVYYDDPAEIVVTIVDMSSLDIAQTLTHEFIHHLLPGLTETQASKENMRCWAG